MRVLRAFLGLWELIVELQEPVEAGIVLKWENGFLFHHQGIWMVKERCSVEGVAGAIIMEPSWAIHSSAPLVKSREGVLVRFVWCETGGQCRRFGGLCPIKCLDRMVQNIGFPLGFYSLYRGQIPVWGLWNVSELVRIGKILLILAYSTWTKCEVTLLPLLTAHYSSGSEDTCSVTEWLIG